VAEFCPRCASPLEMGGDSGRLCEKCGWFGDQTETLAALPPSDVFNPVLAAAQALELFRDACRYELMAEQLYNAGDGTEAQLNQVRVSRRQAAHALIEMFVVLRAWPPKRQLHQVHGIVPWPEDWTDRHFNANAEPCDMLAGPCVCGAWHDQTEPWVQALLVRHNTEIINA
jgi:hypothetical protein